MNFVLDFGNTRIKTGLFEGNNLVETCVFASEKELLKQIDSFSNIKNCLIGSVTKDHVQTSKQLALKFNTRVFESTTPIPLVNLYKSALTLGSDRIAASVGAWSLYPNKNVLTIDAGTCIKYNFVNEKNEYLGGAISPGIPMRLKAMHQFTQALPLVELDKNYDKLTGQSTAESLLSGALVAAACEADAMIDRYMEQHENLQVVITGGDADYLCKQLKNRFFANQNILLQGLNTILNFNLEK
ncbi:type III pantothenate kinase [Aurantibacillus circumpalustris]|uniref:type III pantothenate kinase n=1 Tax=Aurantibacillus circumpalustris TaxID=3036359 RepID=UPI00295B903A|nr:type III pantothenate kinase [Aurantibacillus circumpalustris]